MGILMSALAAAGDAGVQSMNQNIEQQNKFDLQQHMQDLETAKAKEIARFQNQLAIDSANQQRQAQNERIGDAQQGVINSVMARKYGGSDAAVAAADAGQTSAPLTDDQRAAIEQAKQVDIDALKNNQDIRNQAAIQTGDIAPKDAAAMSNKTDIASMKAENFADRTAMMQQMAQIRADATVQSMQLRLDAAKEKAANGKIDTATGRMLITSEDANIKAATSQMNMLNQQLQFSRKEERAGIMAQIDSLRDDIKTSKATKNSYMKEMGFPTSEDLQNSLPKAAPSVLPSLPSGAKQIGTSGGKPVFETPDGKRFIQG